MTKILNPQQPEVTQPDTSLDSYLAALKRCRVMDFKEIENRAHTPGPWKVYDNGFFYDIKVPWQGSSVVEDHSPSLCQVFYTGCDGIQGDANARLIAMAPQMKTALHKVLAECVFKDLPISDDLQLEIMDLLEGYE